MCQEILCQHDGDAPPSSRPLNGPDRRAFLRTAGLAGPARRPLVPVPCLRRLAWGAARGAVPRGAVPRGAVPRDGRHTVMYVEGCPTVDNPTLIQSTGITQLALPWALGGYEYGGVINQIFHGWVGDVRIVNRPLPVSEFMLNQ